MAEIIKIGGEEYEILEIDCTDPPGPWNENVGSWIVYAKPVEKEDK